VSALDNRHPLSSVRSIDLHPPKVTTIIINPSLLLTSSFSISHRTILSATSTYQASDDRSFLSTALCIGIIRTTSEESLLYFRFVI
jgi:hypothetical protein